MDAPVRSLCGPPAESGWACHPRSGVAAPTRRRDVRHRRRAGGLPRNRRRGRRDRWLRPSPAARAPAGGFFNDGDGAAGVFGVLATGFSVRTRGRSGVGVLSDPDLIRDLCEAPGGGYFGLYGGRWPTYSGCSALVRHHRRGDGCGHRRRRGGGGRLGLRPPRRWSAERWCGDRTFDGKRG
jgi:hypothetical protein